MILILDTALNILQTKNLENGDILNLCKTLFDLIGNFILKICDVGYKNLPSLLPVYFNLIFILFLLF